MAINPSLNTFIMENMIANGDLSDVSLGFEFFQADSASNLFIITLGIRYL